MNYSRRNFIQKSAFALGSLRIAGLHVDCGKRSGGKNIFKYAFCNEIIQDYSWPEQCQIIAEAGYQGVEIAPFTLVKEGVEEISRDKRKQMVQDMKNAGLECVGLHWLFVPPPQGLHFTTTDKDLRMKSIEYLKKLIDFCGDIGGEILVFGSPNQRRTVEGQSVEEATKNYEDGLLRVADLAKSRNVKILIEPLTHVETNVINTLEQAMKIINNIGHSAISTMFDFHNSVDETEPLPNVIKKYFSHIDHVHVHNMDGTLITTDAIPEDYIPVFKALKDLNYKKWISLEIFDFTPGGKYIANESYKSFMEIEKRIM